MADDIKLDLKKPLEKMTAKELRALVMEKLPMITGATGMDKDALVSNIKSVLGISEEAGGISPYKEQIHSMKRKMRELRTKKAEASSRKEKSILRRRVTKLKKRTRSLSRSA